MAGALRLENVPESSYYTWRRDHPALDTQVRVQAQALVAVEVDLERARAARMREVERLRTEETLLKGITPLLERLIEDTENEESIHVRITALRELRQWLSTGVFDTGTASAAEDPTRALPPPSLPDFLTGQISKVSVESPGGDKITVERGQPIEGEVT